MSLEWKSLEGQRIQGVLGAIGALPAAALVFGETAAASAPGAPLYTAAIVLTMGAYMHWIYTDGVYHISAIPFRFTVEDLARYRAWEQHTLIPAGYQFQAMTYAYGISSLLCTVLGLMGVYSSLRTGLSVEIGFVAVIVVACAVSFEIVASARRRNALTFAAREWSKLHQGEPD